MNLITLCNQCQKEISVSARAMTRPEMALKKGSSLALQCKYCGHSQQYHLNRFKATETKAALLVAGAVLLIGTPLTFYFLIDYFFRSINIYFIAALAITFTVPSLIYGIIRREQQKAINAFNRYSIRE
jgi:hypothetical protein